MKQNSMALPALQYDSGPQHLACHNALNYDGIDVPSAGAWLMAILLGHFANFLALRPFVMGSNSRAQGPTW